MEDLKIDYFKVVFLKGKNFLYMYKLKVVFLDIFLNWFRLEI